MAIIATDNGGQDFEKCPPGTHLARCIQIIDLGTHKIVGQHGEKHLRKIRIVWEIFGPQRDDGTPFILSAMFTLSLGQNAALRKFLENWRAKPFTAEELAGFDVSKLLNQPCFVTVIHDKNYVNVTSASVPPSGVTVPPATLDIFEMSLSPEFFVPAVFDALTDKTKAYIQESPEYQALIRPVLSDPSVQGSIVNPDYSDIPF